eukprot:TRINITY_DN33196_c0_g1_i1.p2 TRINITY_DN33196_c0_g1~~TRINITY_DN33196_c0_g1_i1.p2  ORF type:complete len:377 (+),score=158.40 TRINITY_DN33196_c0_g1_i1:52-1182(+)
MPSTPPRAPPAAVLADPSDAGPTGGVVASVVGLYIVLYAGGSLCTSLSQEEGGYRYNPIALTFIVGCVKWVVSVAALVRTGNVPAREDFKWGAVQETCKFAFLALVYLIDDNMYFAVLVYLSPAEASLFSNVKVLTTTLFFRVILKRTVKPVQWSALCLLALGLATSKLTEGKMTTAFSVGHVLVVVVSCLGSVADVYCEKLLKDQRETSIHLQNTKLYSFGIAFNLIAMLLYQAQADEDGGGSRYSSFNVFQHFNFWSLLLILCNALQGLTVSVIFKYLDNLWKVQAQAGAMVVTVTLSAVLLGPAPKVGFYLGVGIVLNALYIYNITKQMDRAPPPALPVPDIPSDDDSDRGAVLSDKGSFHASPATAGHAYLA